MYLTYEEYVNMGGTLTETAFNEFEFEAECIIDWYTFDRLKKDTEYPEAVKRCVYKIIKIALSKDSSFTLGDDMSGNSTKQGAVVSQSNDGVSISYNAMSATDLFSKADDEIKLAITVYLANVTNSLGHKVLYRGIYPNE